MPDGMWKQRTLWAVISYFIHFTLETILLQLRDLKTEWVLYDGAFYKAQRWERMVMQCLALSHLCLRGFSLDIPASSRMALDQWF